MNKWLIAGGVVAVVGTGAFFYYKHQVSVLQDSMWFQPIGFKFNSTTLELVEADVKLRVFSDSTLSAELSGINMDVRLDGIKVAKIMENKPIIVPAKGYSDVDIKLTFSPKEIGGNALDLFKSYWAKKDFKIAFDGNIKVKAAFVHLSVPFYYEDSLKYLMS